jgi:hypothetical protein
MLGWLSRPLTTCALLVPLAAAGCGRRATMLDEAPAPPAQDSQPAVEEPRTVLPSPTPRSAQGGIPAPGAHCSGRQDCPSDQVCVASACHSRETSVAGELLAVAARGQAEAGDWDAALRTYDQSIERFDAARAPVPPAVLCGAAALALRTARDPEGRERGAQRADACFRASLPGTSERAEVLQALTRLRFEGLDPGLFDRPQAAERFFTQEASRPTVDALALTLELTVQDEPGAAEIRSQLDGEGARRAIAECFVQDWDVRHERSASAAVVVRYAARLRDMGTFDAFDPEVSFEKTTAAEDGFEPCLARALGPVVSAPRAARVVAWQGSLHVTAQIR